MSQDRYDVVIVGAGLVGLATALNLLTKRPDLRLAVLEKESDVAQHQSGRNSGVIHSGIYYRTGSLKSDLCISGRQKLIRYCDEHKIPYRQTGKLIVAVTASEISRLEELERRAHSNGLMGVCALTAEQVRELEPNCPALAALHVPETAITDYGMVARCISQEIQRKGARLVLGARVQDIDQRDHEMRMCTSSGAMQSNYLINCAGLHADTVAKFAGLDSKVRIVPFRGEYFYLHHSRRHVVRGLIYPVPDPAMPFLGVHFTQHLDGNVAAGPNAVLALSREGYEKTDIDLRSLRAMLTTPHFRNMVRRHWHTGVNEMARSVSRSLFVASLRKLVPAISAADLIPGRPGVRPQAVGRDGRLIDDFVIETAPRSIHVLNAPSPAATACLAIGDYVSSRAFDVFDL